MRTSIFRPLLLLAAALLLLSACLPREIGVPRSLSLPGAGHDAAASVAGSGAQAGLGKLPLAFVENRGQVDPRVGFTVRAHGTVAYVTGDGLTYRFVSSPSDRAHPRAGDGSAPAAAAERPASWVLKTDFVGANPDARPTGLDRTDATFNFFRGRQDAWVTAVPVYRGVGYADLWPGVDLVFGERDGQLKYDLVLQPGADPSSIALAYRGATGARVTESGDVAIETGLGTLVEHAPYAYQDVDGQRIEVPAAFTLESDAALSQHVLSFRLGEYDVTRPLVIDPTIVFAGYIGGDQNDEGMAIAVDTAGNVYVTGQTGSSDATFPETVGPDLNFNGGSDAFVAKVRADGTGLVYAGYIGGTQGDGGFTLTGGMGIAVDTNGSAYVTGRTQSTTADSFPITAGAFDNTLGGTVDAFVAKVKADGTGLDYATYLGGAGNEEGIAIKVDNAGNAYVTGVTDSPAASFPVTGTPAQATEGGGEDAFIAKLNPTGSALVYAGYIGGAGADRGRGVAVDGAGNAYVVGTTNSPAATFPETVGPSLTLKGGTDAFVAKISPNGQVFAYAGYVGGTVDDEGLAIWVSGACVTNCPAYISGETQSTVAQQFPAVVGPSLTHGGGDDGFVARVKGDGTGLDFAGYIGGTQNDSARGVSVDSAGFVYVTGNTFSSPAQSFPFVNAPTLPFGGGQDAFLAKVRPDGSAFSFSGFIGGTGATEVGFGVHADVAGNAYVVGYTDSSEATFPDLIGPSTTFVGGAGFLDTFVAKIATAANLSITKVDSPDPVNTGQALTYTMSATNSGPLPATNVTVNDTLAPGADFVSATASQGSCTFTPATRLVTCTLGSIAAGITATITLVVTPTAAGPYTNTATVTQTEDEATPANNSASQTTTVEAGPPTPTPTLPPVSCAPRPPVLVNAVPNGPGQILVTVRVSNGDQGNELRQMRFGTTRNALVTAGGHTGNGDFIIPLPPGTREFQFLVQRLDNSQGAIAPFFAVDACGDWKSFAGLGTAVP